MKFSHTQRNIKAVFRFCVLVFSLLDVLMRFAFLRLNRGPGLTRRDRAEWLHRACALIVRRLSMGVSASGNIPAAGLIVSNHLSHLDILLYAALMPCVFVSKTEVIEWPMFGILARCGGTIFVERSRRHGVGQPASVIASALTSGIPVILFPEGTSTDGSRVLPFHSAFLQPAIETGTPIVPAAIAYSVTDGIEADLCYYGDISFFPHLLGVLGHEGVEGKILFGEGRHVFSDRKTAARETWSHVVQLRERRECVSSLSEP